MSFVDRIGIISLFWLFVIIIVTLVNTGVAFLRLQLQTWNFIVSIALSRNIFQEF